MVPSESFNEDQHDVTTFYSLQGSSVLDSDLSKKTSWRAWDDSPEWSLFRKDVIKRAILAPTLDRV